MSTLSVYVLHDKYSQPILISKCERYSTHEWDQENDRWITRDPRLPDLITVSNESTLERTQQSVSMNENMKIHSNLIPTRRKRPVRKPDDPELTPFCHLFPFQNFHRPRYEPTIISAKKDKNKNTTHLRKWRRTPKPPTKKTNAAAQGTYNAPSYCKPHPMSKDDESIMRFFEVQDQDGSGEGGETSLLGDPWSDLEKTYADQVRLWVKTCVSVLWTSWWFYHLSRSRTSLALVASKRRHSCIRK